MYVVNGLRANDVLILPSNLVLSYNLNIIIQMIKFDIEVHYVIHVI